MKSYKPTPDYRAMDVPEDWKALPQRLRGRGEWLHKRGRIKDAELMFDAATEIEGLRNFVPKK